MLFGRQWLTPGLLSRGHFWSLLYTRNYFLSKLQVGRLFSYLSPTRSCQIACLAKLVEYLRLVLSLVGERQQILLWRVYCNLSIFAGRSGLGRDTKLLTELSRLIWWRTNFWGKSNTEFVAIYKRHLLVTVCVYREFPWLSSRARTFRGWILLTLHCLKCLWIRMDFIYHISWLLPIHCSRELLSLIGF